MAAARLARRGGHRRSRSGGREVRSAVREWTDLDHILADQDAAGTDVVVLSPLVLLLGYDAEPDEGAAPLRGSRTTGSRAWSATAAGAWRRSAPCRCRTRRWPRPSCGELMAEGVLRGVEIAASVRGRFLGDDAFEPFWAAAEETGALVFVHPTTRGFDAPGVRRALPLERGRQPARDDGRRGAPGA